MGLKLVTPPSVEPITLSEAKLHLRVIQDNEDALIESLITAAREYCEDFQNRAYVEQTWKLTFDEWPEFPFELPKPPLISVEKIEYKDDEGNVTEWDDDNYVVDEYSFLPRVALADDYTNSSPLSGGLRVETRAVLVLPVPVS